MGGMLPQAGRMTWSACGLSLNVLFWQEAGVTDLGLLKLDILFYSWKKKPDLNCTC